MFLEQMQELISENKNKILAKSRIFDFLPIF